MTSSGEAKGETLQGKTDHEATGVHLAEAEVCVRVVVSFSASLALTG